MAYANLHDLMDDVIGFVGRRFERDAIGTDGVIRQGGHPGGGHGMRHRARKHLPAEGTVFTATLPATPENANVTP